MKKITDIKQAYGLEGATIYMETTNCKEWKLGEYWSGSYSAETEDGDTALLTPSDLIGEHIVETVEWWVIDRESGNLIEQVYSIEEGQDLIMEYEEQDKEDGVYVADFYEVVSIPRK